MSSIASLLTHLVATGWAGFQIYNTAQFRSDFADVTTNGACHPIDYFQPIGNLVQPLKSQAWC